MKTLMYICSYIACIILGLIIGLLADQAQARVDQFEAERARHVLEVWGDGLDHQNHDCEYGPEWCNPVYAKFLREHAK